MKAGRIPALKLLTKFEIRSTKGQPRQVQDYAFTDEIAKQVGRWIESQLKPEVKGFTVEQIQTLSDADLMSLIQQQKKPIRKRRNKTKAATEKVNNEKPEAGSEPDTN